MIYLYPQFLRASVLRSGWFPSLPGGGPPVSAWGCLVLPVPGWVSLIHLDELGNHCFTLPRLALICKKEDRLQCLYFYPFKIWENKRKVFLIGLLRVLQSVVRSRGYCLDTSFSCLLKCWCWTLCWHHRLFSKKQNILMLPIWV